MSTVHNKPVSMPDAFIILFFVMILAAIASHLIPAGVFTLTEPAPVAEGAAKLKGKILFSAVKVVLIWWAAQCRRTASSTQQEATLVLAWMLQHQGCFSRHFPNNQRKA